MRRAVRRGVPAALCALLLAGCGLPLPDGVRSAREVPAEQRRPEPISVLPPGPQPGAEPQEVVLGFLAAQGSARDDHGIARSFLTDPARAEWNVAAGVTVYDPRSVTVSPPVPDGDGVTVTLGLDVVGAVAPDGSARTSSAARAVRRYALRQDAGQWRLSRVPPGLALSPGERDRSYDPLQVHFLAPAVPGGPRHLVADLVHLPAGADRAAVLVDRLLAGPSAGLGDSAATAVPPGTRVRRPVRTSAEGEVTVDLSSELLGLPDDGRRDLSAQLVWTLRQVPDFSRLRLLVDGEPLEVSGTRSPQPRSAWGAYAPDGPLDAPSAVALVDGELRPLDPPEGPRGSLPAVDARRIVDFAVDPRSDRLAALSTSPDGRTVHTGPRSGPLVAGPSGRLHSPTWGSGEGGLWLLRAGPRPALLVLRPDGRQLVEVSAPGLPSLDAGSLLRVSRDGVRVAVVTEGVLYVGRVVAGDGPPRLTGLRRLTGQVRDVAWRTGTSLAVLVDDDTAPLLPLLSVSVDGTSATSSGLLGVSEGSPVALAAYGSQPLLVEVRLDERATVYTGDSGRGFQVRLRDAVRPSYPR